MRKAPPFNMSNITYCGIHFNVEVIQEQTEEDFVNAPENRQHWKQPGFTISDKARKERLREIYRLVNPQKIQHAHTQQPDTSGVQPESGQPDPGIHGSSVSDLPGATEEENDLSEHLNPNSDEKIKRTDSGGKQYTGK